MQSGLPPLKGLLPNHPNLRDDAVGQCIYCGISQDLTDEHVIPLGLGGRHILPKASCKSCASITSAYERTCLRTMFGPLRLLYGLPTRRKKSRPESLQLKIKRQAESEWEYVPVSQERFPFLISFPYFDGPTLLGAPNRGSLAAATSRLWIRGASPSYSFDTLCMSLAKELNAHTIMPECKADSVAFGRLLAKIAYAFSYPRIQGISCSNPLASFATTGDLNSFLCYVGGPSQDPPPSNNLHEVSLVSIGSHIAVRIRLLAILGTPVYFVVVTPPK